MSAAPEMLDGLASLAPDYEGFLVDLWGTLHDGFRPLPGAADCLARLRRIGPVVLVSNAHRRRSRELARLRAMGLPETAWDGLVTAGELCRRRLADVLPAGCRRYGFLGIEEDARLLDGRRFRRVTALGEAQFLLLGDPPGGTTDPAVFDGTLDEARARGLPLVCPNPDRWSVWGAERRLKPGAIAERYERRGGRVLWFGKPDPVICRDALAQAALDDRRVLMIGDGLDSDMAAAAAAGLDGCWVLGGRDAASIASAGGVAMVCRQARLWPRAVVATFAW